MCGYLNAEADEKFVSWDGWYDTGDVGRVDEDGFLFIIGRMKRFAKISGEMVSLAVAEEALAGAFPQYGSRFRIAVLARPDSERGEALVAVCNEAKLQAREVRAAIDAKGLSNLHVPKEIKVVPDIPKLGTGKTDYRALQEMIMKDKPAAVKA